MEYLPPAVIFWIKDHGPSNRTMTRRRVANFPVALATTYLPLYRYRNLVESFFNKIKHYRAVATRYDKTPENFLAGVKLASLRIWIHSAPKELYHVLEILTR